MRERWHQYLVLERGLSPVTAWTYEHGLRRIERFTQVPAPEIDTSKAREFLRSGYHPATKQSSLAALKSFHRWGAVEGLWPLNGIMALQGPRMVHNPKPSLRPEQVTHIESYVNRPNAARVFYLGLYAGLRVTEASLVEGWEGGVLSVKGKGGKLREVPVHAEIEQRKDLILSSTAKRDNLKHSVRGLSFASGIPFTSHTFRRTFGVRLSELGVSRDVIAALLGHRGGVTIEHYVPVTMTEKREAVLKLFY